MKLQAKIMVIILAITVPVIGFVVLLLVGSLPDNFPHLIIFTLPVVFTAEMYFLRGEEGIKHEYISYTCLILFTLAWGSLRFFVSAVDTCSGPGAGGNLALRICQPKIELFVLTGFIIIFGFALVLFQKMKFSTRYRLIGMGVVFLSLLVGSTWIWVAPFMWV